MSFLLCQFAAFLFVHEKIYDTVIGKLVTAYKQVETKIGDPTLASTLMGPLNSQESVHQFLNAIEKAKASGGQVLTGGSAVEGRGNFVLPTIISFILIAKGASGLIFSRSAFNSGISFS